MAASLDTDLIADSSNSPQSVDSLGSLEGHPGFRRGADGKRPYRGSVEYLTLYHQTEETPLQLTGSADVWHQLD